MTKTSNENSVNKISNPDNDLDFDLVNYYKNLGWPNPFESWLLDDDKKGPRVITSVATTGSKHNLELAGSMSPAWGQPLGSSAIDLGARGISGADFNHLNIASVKEAEPGRFEEVMKARKDAAANRVKGFLETLGGPELEDDVVIIKPQVDHYKDRTVRGNIVCADDFDRNGEYIEDTRPAFMMYSRDPERVLGIRPADCPTIAFSGYDRNGEPIHGLIHGGWQDADAGFEEQGLSYLDKELDVDIKDLNFYIGPGGIEFDYKRPTDPRDGNDPMIVHNGWKTRTRNHTKNDDGSVSFIFDMHGFACDRLFEAGAAPEQIYVDSSDTTAENSGYSSHKLASQGKKPPMRDLVLVFSPDRKSHSSKTTLDSNQV